VQGGGRAGSAGCVYRQALASPHSVFVHDSRAALTYSLVASVSRLRTSYGSSKPGSC